MNSKPITVVATFQAKTGKAEELKKALLSLVAPTRKEAGCVLYELHQLPDAPDKFLFYETWTSKTHLEAHLQSPHIQALFPRLGDLSMGLPEIQIWEKVS